jgi:hypothetical protein
VEEGGGGYLCKLSGGLGTRVSVRLQLLRTQILHGFPGSVLNTRSNGSAPSNTSRRRGHGICTGAVFRAEHAPVTDLRGLMISVTVSDLRTDISDGHFLGNR